MNPTNNLDDEVKTFIERCDTEIREDVTAQVSGEINRDPYITKRILQDELKTLFAQAKQQMVREIMGKASALRQDEHPTEDGIPVETYGYEQTHNEAIDQVTALLEQYLIEPKLEPTLKEKIDLVQARTFERLNDARLHVEEEEK